jgi:hypothetical protein
VKATVKDPATLDKQIRERSSLTECVELSPEPTGDDREVEVSNRLSFDDGVRAADVVPFAEKPMLDGCSKPSQTPFDVWVLSRIDNYVHHA